MTAQLRWQSVAKGLETLVPWVSGFAISAVGSPVGVRYYYAVWLRHSASLAAARPGFSCEVAAKLGPGDGLGLGICALPSGARRYIGVDRLAFGLRADSLQLLDELLALFRGREAVPGDAAMHRWLKPDGVMSLRIDYTSHGITHDWYGHWTESPAVWRIVRGKRAYLTNRLVALQRNRFDIMACTPTPGDAAAPAASVRIAHEPSDLPIKGAFIVARPASP